MNDSVVSGLIRRRRELAGDLLELMAKVDALTSDIEALDRVLRQFDPGIRLSSIPPLKARPKPDWALHGDVVRIVFDTLRGAQEPLSTHSLAKVVLAQRGVAGEPTRTHLKRVRKCLDRQRARGTLCAEDASGLLCWALAR